MEKDEEPGFTPEGKPFSDASVEEFVSGGDLTDEDLERLREDGFLATLYQPLKGPPKTAGVTVMTLYETPEGAKSDMAYELSSKTLRDLGLKLEGRFTAPGVPGARGWVGKDIHGFNIGHVYWVQGRCMLLIGNEGPGPFPGPLSEGAKAIYERTNGECP